MSDDNFMFGSYLAAAPTHLIAQIGPKMGPYSIPLEKLYNISKIYEGLLKWVSSLGELRWNDPYLEFRNRC